MQVDFLGDHDHGVVVVLDPPASVVEREDATTPLLSHVAVVPTQGITDAYVDPRECGGWLLSALCRRDSLVHADGAVRRRVCTLTDSQMSLALPDFGPVDHMIRRVATLRHFPPVMHPFAPFRRG